MIRALGHVNVFKHWPHLLIALATCSNVFFAFSVTIEYIVVDLYFDSSGMCRNIRFINLPPIRCSDKEVHYGTGKTKSFIHQQITTIKQQFRWWRWWIIGGHSNLHLKKNNNAINRLKECQAAILKVLINVNISASSDRQFNIHLLYDRKFAKLAVNCK